MINLSKSVKWNLSVAVEGAPTITSSEDSQTDAVDVISISVNKSSTITADIQPGDLDEVKLLYIKLKEKDLYGKIKYKFNDDTNDSVEVILDKDHFLTSSELVKLFKISPNKIIFTNSDSNTVAGLEIVVARKAIP